MKNLIDKIKTELKANPIIELVLFIWGAILVSTIGAILVNNFIVYVLKHI